jgi:hypothetical protein
MRALFGFPDSLAHQAGFWIGGAREESGGSKLGRGLVNTSPLHTFWIWNCWVRGQGDWVDGLTLIQNPKLALSEAEVSKIQNPNPQLMPLSPNL